MELIAINGIKTCRLALDNSFNSRCVLTLALRKQSVILPHPFGLDSDMMRSSFGCSFDVGHLDCRLEQS